MDKFNTAREARNKILEHAPEIIEKYIDYSMGRLYDFQGDPNALTVLFKTIVPVLKIEEDTHRVNIQSDDRESMIKAVTKEMLDGLITASEAGRMIEAIKTGMDIIEIEAMVNDIRNGDD